MDIDVDDVLNAKMPPNDADAKTVREYLVKLLLQLWQEGESFSGKWPFGNSGWAGDLEHALVRSSLIDGQVVILHDGEEEYEDLVSADTKAATEAIKMAIESLGRIDMSSSSTSKDIVNAKIVEAFVWEFFKSSCYTEFPTVKRIVEALDMKQDYVAEVVDSYKNLLLVSHTTAKSEPLENQFVQLHMPPDIASDSWDADCDWAWRMVDKYGPHKITGVRKRHQMAVELAEMLKNARGEHK